MDGDARDQAQEAAELRLVGRLLSGAVPVLVDRLRAARPGRVHHEALVLLERPLLMHVLALTGGNQLRAARLLGINRNTLRKRCRELRLSLPRASRRGAAPAPTPRA
jgi:DNA-binding protein Fis